MTLSRIGQIFEQGLNMKANIHPEAYSIKAICGCGAQYNIMSSLKGDIRLDVCSNCHPYYTGEQNIVDTEGRVDSFKKRFGGFSMGSASSKKTEAN